ncbi:SAF domain protein [Desulfonatronospira thiodismutans ASO3-1]|uniref:SAF domain protein n=1 Tax=Desulfonatronospira thiodismutans ASO3-1 TaxID=555779 RepID=D6SKT8_9BACT|nr:NAD(P)-dependent oxidoreductase [Desulfonatronospira thiodismutans]EFI35299.1 SAF domain protein [Desulfonatronospira thiodismutans ASO3-1]
MIILDTALKKRQQENNPVRVGVIGAGYMGRGTVFQAERAVPGMRVSSVYNRHIDEAARAYEQAGINDFSIVETKSQLEDAIVKNRYSITENPELICQAQGIEAVIEATGEIDFAAKLCLIAMEHGKHIILMNAELDATLGPILKIYADRAGVVFSNADGDQPGVLMNLMRYVQTIGCRPVLAGNVKGLHDPYRTPETQKGYARKYHQKPRMVTSFADGTKISFEMAVVANATGFKAGQRGMYGPACAHVSQSAPLFPLDQMLDTGLVDYVLGAEPPGVFVLGYNDEPLTRQYMDYYKMGTGPVYVFYTPYHLPSIEAPLTAARAVLFKDPAITPMAGPVCEVVTTAKRGLKSGDVLDGIGGFDTYGVLENTPVAMEQNLLPMGLAGDCRLKRDIKKDQVITYNDVQVPAGRVGDMLKNEQLIYFTDRKTAHHRSVSDWKSLSLDERCLV